MCTCALVSSAISAAFSPPHRPTIPLGGRSGLDGSQGPSTTAAAVKAKAALVSIGTSLPIYPVQTTFGHYALPTPTAGPHVPRLSLGPSQQRPLTGLDAYVARAMTDWRVPGLAIVVVKDDSVLFIKGYGVRELGKPDPVTVHTRFGNMSTTKAFTALLVAMLADSGRVGFDDPVQKYLPQLQLADPYVTRELTVRDLLTHRVGFGDPEYLWSNSARFRDDRAPSAAGARHHELPVAVPVQQRHLLSRGRRRSTRRWDDVAVVAARPHLRAARHDGELRRRERAAGGRHHRSVVAPRHRARYRSCPAGAAQRHRRHRARGLGVYDRDRHGEMAALPARLRQSRRPAARQPPELRRAVQAAADPGAAVLSHCVARASAFPGVRSGLDPPGLSRRIRRHAHRLHRRTLGHRGPAPGPARRRRDLHEPRSLRAAPRADVHRVRPIHRTVAA